MKWAVVIISALFFVFSACEQPSEKAKNMRNQLSEERDSILNLQAENSRVLDSLFEIHKSLSQQLRSLEGNDTLEIENLSAHEVVFKEHEVILRAHDALRKMHNEFLNTHKKAYVKEKEEIAQLNEILRDHEKMLIEHNQIEKEQDNISDELDLLNRQLDSIKEKNRTKVAGKQ